MKFSSNDSPNKSSIMDGWYWYAQALPGSVESLLIYLRERQRMSEEEQRLFLGATPQSFLRLRAMRVPRATHFVEDAHRIGEACSLTNVRGFVSAMLLARNLVGNLQDTSDESYYEAALDDHDDLDSLEEE